MSAPVRDDWEALSDQWRADGADPGLQVELLIQRVRTHRRLMHGVLAVEILITTASLAASLWLLDGPAGPTSRAVAAYIWVLLAAVWSFALWNRRGTWRPVAETVSAFRGLAMLRCRRQLRTAWFVLGFSAVQFGCVTLWLSVRMVTEVPPLPLAAALAGWIAGAVLTAGLLGWAAWLARRSRRELAWLNGGGFETDSA